MKIKPKNKLAGVLAENSITNREVARYLQVSETTFTSWLKGNTSPKIDICIELHGYLQSKGIDITLHKLFS